MPVCRRGYELTELGMMQQDSPFPKIFEPIPESMHKEFAT